MSPDNTGQIQAGRFQKGQSGNPYGRPRGARNSATVVAEALLDGEAEALTRKAIEMALGGDTSRCGFAWSGYCPYAKTAR
jgi:hypothetical protein